MVIKNTKKIVSILLIFLLSISSNLLFNNPSMINRNNEKIEKEKIPKLKINAFSYDWNATWGYYNPDRGYGLCFDSLENIYVAGTTESAPPSSGYFDTLLLKYNSSGNLIWDDVWGAGGDYDLYLDITIDHSDNIYTTGYKGAFGGGYWDILLAKYDTNGTQKWYKTWGEGGSIRDYGQTVAVDNTGSIYVVGQTQSYEASGIDAVLLKYYDNGTLGWYRLWGGVNTDKGHGIAIDQYNNIYIVGYTESFTKGGNDAFLVKYDSDGNQIWNETWGGVNDDYCYDIRIADNNDIFIAGSTESFTVGGSDSFLIKYDETGAKLWNNTWGLASSNEVIFSIAENSYNLFLGAYSDGFGAGYDILIMSCDYEGNLLWNKTWGGGNDDFLKEIEVDKDNNIFFTGLTFSDSAGQEDCFLVKFSCTSTNPEIKNLQYSPISPTSSDLITIKANITDDNNEIDQVLLYYKVGTANWQNVEMLEGIGNQYTGNIGPYPTNTSIKFYIKANDSLGLSSKLPFNAPTFTYKIQIGHENSPIWKKNLRNAMLLLKSEINRSIDCSLELLSDMIAITLNDVFNFGLEQTISEFIRYLWTDKLDDFLNDENFKSLMFSKGITQDDITLFASLIYENNEDFLQILQFIDVILESIINLGYLNGSEIKNLLTNNEMLNDILYLSKFLEQIEQMYSSFDIWLNVLPNDLPSFKIDSVLGIIESITTSITQGSLGNIATVITPDGKVFPTSSILNLKEQLDFFHNTLTVANTAELYLDLLSGTLGVISLITSVTGIGAPIGAAAGTLYSTVEIMENSLVLVQAGSIIAELLYIIIATSETNHQILNYLKIFEKTSTFLQETYVSPIDFNGIKIDIIDIESPDIFSLVRTMGNGTLTVRNNGVVGGNIVITATIRGPDTTPLYAYYMSEYLDPNEEHVFNTCYFGYESDFFDLQPFIIEFKVFMYGMYQDIEKDYFYIGLGSMINETANSIEYIKDILIEYGANAWIDITTELGDIWTTISGGDAQSNIDLRLWNEEKTQLLVGVNYTTNETINLINANYSGSMAVPEYIKIPNPNSTNYFLEIIGESLPFAENTSIIYINTGARNATLGVQNHINSSIYYSSGEPNNFNISLQILEASGQSTFSNLKINSSDLIFSGKSLVPLNDISNINLIPGEKQFVSINYTYSADLIDGNYSGIIYIWNETTLLREIPITVEMLNISKLFEMKIEGLPVIDNPVISSNEPIEFTDVTVNVTVSDNNKIEAVYLFYSINDVRPWNLIELDFIGGDIYSTIIPGQIAGANISFQIYAFDNESYLALDDNNGSYYLISYQNSPSKKISFGFYYLCYIYLTLIVAIYVLRKKFKT